MKTFRLLIFWFVAVVNLNISQATCWLAPVQEKQPGALNQSKASSSAAIRLEPKISETLVTVVAYQVRIQGKIFTPSTSGPTELDLSSTADFEFHQRQFSPAVNGPFGLRAIRQFQKGASSTIVAKDFKTEVQLPDSHRTLHVYGSDSAINHLSPKVRLTRQQVDLLQMPFDPLIVNSLLPDRELNDVTEKWNSDAWVLPLLFGMEAAVTQSASCQISALTDSTATIIFELNADGAVNGSASNVSAKGTLTFDRRTSMVSGLKGTLTEKRSPGTVSPGLDIVAEIQWTQKQTDDNDQIPTTLPESAPSEGQLLLTLVTPWRLTLLHSREWHLFHETADLVMLRFLRNGSLNGQCNIAPSISVPPGEFTPEETFRSEVQEAIRTREATIASSTIAADVNGWRVHTIQAKSVAGEKGIQWDYHLCTHPNGQQFLVIFSCTSDDKATFAPEAELLLKSLTLHPITVRPRIPLPR